MTTKIEFRRPQLIQLTARLEEPRRFMQVLAGPRQTGKTTLIQQALDSIRMHSHYSSADEPALRGTPWIEQQWEVARSHAREKPKRGSVLVLDEIQKIPGWSETVKRLWDEDTRKKIPL